MSDIDFITASAIQKMIESDPLLPFRVIIDYPFVIF